MSKSSYNSLVKSQKDRLPKAVLGCSLISSSFVPDNGKIGDYIAHSYHSVEIDTNGTPQARFYFFYIINEAKWECCIQWADNTMVRSTQFEQWSHAYRDIRSNLKAISTKDNKKPTIPPAAEVELDPRIASAEQIVSFLLAE